MQRNKIVEQVKGISLRKNEYIVVGSGLLGALKLRDVEDIDLVVSPEILDRYESKDGWRKEVRYGKTFLLKEPFEMFSELAWEDYQTTRGEAIASARYIDGVPFLNIEETIKFKQALGREKDYQDIKLLKQYHSQSND